MTMLLVSKCFQWWQSTTVYVFKPASFTSVVIISESQESYFHCEIFSWSAAMAHAVQEKLPL